MKTKNIEGNVNIETSQKQKINKESQDTKAISFEEFKKQLKPRLKCLSKNNLIEIALRLSVEVTNLKGRLQDNETKENSKDLK